MTFLTGDDVQAEIDAALEPGGNPVVQLKPGRNKRSPKAPQGRPRWISSRRASIVGGPGENYASVGNGDATGLPHSTTDPR